MPLPRSWGALLLLSSASGIRSSRGGDVPIERRGRDAEAVRDLGDADVGIGQQCPRGVKVIVGEFGRTASGAAGAPSGGVETVRAGVRDCFEGTRRGRNTARAGQCRLLAVSTSGVRSSFALSGAFSVTSGMRHFPKYSSRGSGVGVRGSPSHRQKPRINARRGGHEYYPGHNCYLIAPDTTS